jgi:hypothetical protein
MDIISLLNDYSIDYVTEGHKHSHAGWVNVHCPHCEGSNNYHLGFNVNGAYSSCYRCGFHPLVDSISMLLNIPWHKAKEIIKQYGGKTYIKYVEKAEHQNTKPHKLPSPTTPLQPVHKRYLESRGFDPDYLEKVWGLMGTGAISLLGDLNYKHRIIIPYVWNGKQVSFDARDITGKAMTKYQACPLEREIIPHKDILYGKQEAWKETGICVEGTTDVWRLGARSFATSGINFMPKQLKIIAKTFKRVAVVFDSSPKKEKSLSIESIKANSNISKEMQAEKQAKELIAELRFRGVDAFRVSIIGDPATMEQSEADYFVKQLIK